MSDYVTISKTLTRQQAEAAEGILLNADWTNPRKRREALQAMWESMLDLAPRPPSVGLTKLQRFTLDNICQLIDETGQSPTLAEIGRRMHLTPDRVCKLVNALHDHKYINRRKSQKRGIQVIKRP
jgi:DNA-binding MarR family transcriptional regulator